MVIASSVVGCVLALVMPAGIDAKIPGETHCYGLVCHRVHTLAETAALIGRILDVTSSYYDDPARDRHTPNTVTSSGEAFDASSPFSTASAHFPDGTELLVLNPRNGHASHIRVNDFGPFAGERTLDVTRRVAEDLGFSKSGTAPLRVMVIAAPSVEETRYRAYRRYRPVKGFLGVLSGDEFDGLGRQLIAGSSNRERGTDRLAQAEPRLSAPGAAGPGAPPVAARLPAPPAGSGPTPAPVQVTKEPLSGVRPAVDPAPEPDATSGATVVAVAVEPRPVAAAPEPPDVTQSIPEPIPDGADDVRRNEPSVASVTRAVAEIEAPSLPSPVTAAPIVVAMAVPAPAAESPSPPPGAPAPEALPMQAGYGETPSSASEHLAPAALPSKDGEPDRAGSRSEAISRSFARSLIAPSPELLIAMLAIVLTTAMLVRRARVPAQVRERRPDPENLVFRHMQLAPLPERELDVSVPTAFARRTAQTPVDGGAEGRAADTAGAGGKVAIDAPPPPPPPPDSTITAEFEINGNVTTPLDLRLFGRVTGDVVCRDAVIASDGVVAGRLIARQAVVDGTVIGGIEADRVHLRPGSRIDGDIVADVLQVDEGAHFEGRVLRRTPKINSR